MANIILKPNWQGREQDTTDQSVYKNRRQFIKSLGLGALSLAAIPSIVSACASDAQRSLNAPAGPLDTIPANAPRGMFPAAPNAAYAVPERGLTDRVTAASYNNMYEFSTNKRLWHLTGDYQPFPWTLEVDGLVDKPMTMGIDDIFGLFDFEERIYRHRCVEAWAMTVPWTGFPLKKLIDHCKPLSSATHVMFTSANIPSQMPGIKDQPWYPWPYYEGARMDEVMNELAFVGTGIYGEPLPKQHGSPFRIIFPWKYGYKGAKAVVKITFMDKQPGTFWNDLQPAEYPFLSNVIPKVPHPRWSQASERLLGENRRVRTQFLNGYGDQVGHLYPNAVK